MQFLIIAYDGKDSEALKRRLSARENHIKLSSLMRDRGELLYGVAILNEDRKMVGSVLIAEFPSRKELDTWLEREPYVTGKVWDKIEILPCQIGPSFVNT